MVFHSVFIGCFSSVRDYFFFCTTRFMLYIRDCHIFYLIKTSLYHEWCFGGKQNVWVESTNGARTFFTWNFGFLNVCPFASLYVCPFFLCLLYFVQIFRNGIVEIVIGKMWKQWLKSTYDFISMFRRKYISYIIQNKTKLLFCNSFRCKH